MKPLLPLPLHVPRPRPQPEHGASTVLAVSFLAVLLLLGSALGVAAAMVVAHRSAQSAADLAALAAAAAAADGADPCVAASGIAARNRARLLSCAVTGREVVLEVSVSGPRWLGQSHDLTGRARAGPA